MFACVLVPKRQHIWHLGNVNKAIWATWT